MEQQEKLNEFLESVIEEAGKKKNCIKCAHGKFQWKPLVNVNAGNYAFLQQGLANVSAPQWQAADAKGSH